MQFGEFTYKVYYVVTAHLLECVYCLIDQNYLYSISADIGLMGEYGCARSCTLCGLDIQMNLVRCDMYKNVSAIYTDVSAKADVILIMT